MAPVSLVILASSFDPVAAALSETIAGKQDGPELRRYGLEDLAAARWCQRLGNDGIRTVVRLADDYVLDSEALPLILNRLVYDPSLLFLRMHQKDRDYARSEFHALLRSWLSGPSHRIVNRATTTGLCGPALRPWNWLARAAESGLPLYPASATSSSRIARPARGAIWSPHLLVGSVDPANTMHVFDRPVASAAPPEGLARVLVTGQSHTTTNAALDGKTRAACLQLAVTVGADLLAINLAQMSDDPRWRFVSADPCPAGLDASCLAALAGWLVERM